MENFSETNSANTLTSVEQSIQQTQKLKDKIYKEKNEDEVLEPFKIHHIIMEKLNQNKSQFRKLIKLAYAIRKGLRNDYDFVGALSGREGRGKSTLLIVLLAIIDVTFTMEKRLSLLPQTDEVKRLFKKTRRFGALGIDEAIKALHKQEWYQTVQKDIVHLYATERFQNKATLLAIPRFKDLNENFRNHRVNCWIHVIDRGIAFAYVPVDIPFFQDPWFMDEMEKKYRGLLKRKKGVDITVEDMIKIERSNPCFVDVIEYPDLPEDVKERYLKLKVYARKQEETEKVLDEALDKDKIRKALALVVLSQKENGIKNLDIAEKLGLTKDQVSRLATDGKQVIKAKKLEEMKEKEAKWDT